MAYEIRYIAYWKAKDKNGTLVISQKDYEGSMETIKLQNDAIILTKQLENWESHIVGDVCEFNIINNNPNYFDLLDLMIATEQKYQVVVTCYYDSVLYTLFCGFINTEAVTQKYLNYSTIHLVASSFVSKLENVYPDSLNLINNITFIDIFHEILAQVGNQYSIRVAAFLISSNTVYDVNKTFMNQNGINNEIFWENNVDRVDSRTILEQILTAFNCYLYFWNGCWYIEEFDELFEPNRLYVEYPSGASYTPLDSGTYMILSHPIKDVHDLVFMNTSQTLTVTPGNRTVEVRINQQAYYNLTINDFINVERVLSGLVPIPPIRTWSAWQPAAQTLMVWNAQGSPYKSMVNSIKRTSTQTNLYHHNNAEDYLYLWKGLYTTFLVTNDGSASLSIKWKYSFGGQYVIQEVELERMTWRFRWGLLIYDLSDNFVGEAHWDSDSSIWRLDDLGNHNETDVSGAEFDKDFICEVSISIPIAEIRNYDEPDDLLALGNYKMVFILHTESQYVDSPNKNIIYPSVWYGDVQISASIETFDENVIEGKTNTNFLNKMEVDISIADVPNYNYKNGVLEGSNLTLLTSSWKRNEGILSRKLVDYILVDKFRLGDVSRQRITAQVKSIDLLRPFAMFTESKQANKKFLLTGMVFDAAKDEYEITLDEYDNTTAITLIG